MTRAKLKGIVKECLVEILAEGLNPEAVDISPVKKKSRVTQRQQQEEQRLAEHRKKFEYRVLP